VKEYRHPALTFPFLLFSLRGRRWHELPLVDFLENHFKLPVRLENDANAAAFGEWRYGAGRGAKSVVFVTVSTGTVAA
jgi:predicted NBD/HSP70 family sugar kinase